MTGASRNRESTSRSATMAACLVEPFLPSDQFWSSGTARAGPNIPAPAAASRYAPWRGRFARATRDLWPMPHPIAPIRVEDASRTAEPFAARTPQPEKGDDHAAVRDDAYPADDFSR